MDPAVFGFSAVLTLLMGIVFGLGPSFRAAKEDVISPLRTVSRVFGSSFSRRVRNGLLIAEITLSFVLMIATGLLVLGFYKLLRADGGVNVQHVLTFEMSLPAAKYPDPAHMAKLYSRALHALQGLPEVQAAGVVDAVPMGGAPDASAIRVPGRTLRPKRTALCELYVHVSPGYFAAVRTPLLRGRDFQDSDTLDAAHITIVNRTTILPCTCTSQRIG